MIKYKGIYRVFLKTDIHGKYTTNEDDTYLKCGKHEIFRYSKDQLAIYFQSNEIARNRISEINNLGVSTKLFVSGDKESVYLFDEKDLLLVASIMKPMTKGKDKNPKKRNLNLTDEQRQKLKERAKKLPKFQKKST